ncbi:MAG: hypothetical protein JSR66_03220 [Proteobacteria bacterium]|nr:hypothetical protein [Pseudomonadota bacterium]
MTTQTTARYTLPDPVPVRLEDARGEIFEAMALINVLWKSLSPDDNFNERSVLDRAYSILNSVAEVLNPTDLLKPVGK